MKVSISWLKELVDLNCSIEELVNILPLRSISTKEVTDQFIELDMKGYNRADLLSMVGVAQEVAAITGSKLLFKEPQEADFAWNQVNLPNTKVSVQNPEYAPFYTITKIEGLKPGKSSSEVQKKLLESGIRSIDNITDITNLIMLEYGQPMHAFDARAVKDESIIVRTAKKGERITTLDGKTRDLEENDLLIADSLNALGLAGVMGGKDSEINESTTSILLEAAIFDSANIRKTSTRLGLQSEAGKRFQHGLTKKRLLQALNAAIRMYESIGGKVTAINMVGDFEDKRPTVNLRKQKLEDLVGVKFEDSQVEDYLKKLYFEVEKIDAGWKVTPPYFRLDVNIEEDVIEEVARMYGYEKIPAEKVSQSKPLQKEAPIFETISKLRNQLVDLGLTEVQTYSFYTTAVLESLDFTEEYQKFLIKLANPISAETEYLRMNIWPNLVEVIGRNLRKGHKDIAIFELGKSFHYSYDGAENPEEENVLSIALCNRSDNPLEELISIIGHSELVSESQLEAGPPPGVVANLFHPKRFIHIKKDGQEIGGMGEVHLRVLNKLGIDKRVAVLEINL